MAVEAIGLALGVAPLIVELLKANPEPLHAAKAVKKSVARDMIEDFYTDLEYEVSMLKLTLTQLVDELPLADELKAKLVDERSLDPMVWKRPSPETKASLEYRLNPCYDAFVHSMEKILKLLSKVVKDGTLPVLLHADHVRVCADTPYAKLEEFFDTRFSVSRRMKFAWKKEKRDKIMNGLTKYNRRIEEMLKRTSSTTAGYTPPHKWSGKTCIPHFGLRQKMNELRKAIGRTWCKCAREHELRFGLRETGRTDGQVDFDMLMNIAKDHDKWHWGESKVSIDLTETSRPRACTLTARRRDSAQPRRSRSSSASSSWIDESGSKVENESPVVLTRFTSVGDRRSVNAHVEETNASQASTEANSGTLNVRKLCAVIQNGQKARRASQLILRGATLSHSNTTLERDVRHSDPGIRLEKYLEKGKMTMKDRKVLQVLLAQSVLFYPWVGRDLNKASIAFHPDLDRPFATLLPDHNDSPPKVILEDEAEEPEYRLYNNETLAALAITLLEIELEKPIEDLEIEDDFGDNIVSGFESNFWATTRVLKEQQFNMYGGCYAAIDACLRCDFVDEEMTLDNRDFAQQVYERVVAPLEEELFHGFSITIPFSPSPDTKAEMPVDGHGPGVSVTTISVATPASKKSVKIFEDPHWGEPGVEGARDISPGTSAATAAPTPMVTVAPAASAVP